MSQAVRIEQDEALVVKVSSDTYALSPAVTNMDSFVAVSAAPPLYTGDKGYTIWVVRATGVTTGGTVLIQGCEKNSGVATDWYTIATVSVTATGTFYAVVPMGEVHKFQRANLSVRTDGTYSSNSSSLPLSAVV